MNFNFIKKNKPVIDEINNKIEKSISPTIGLELEDSASSCTRGAEDSGGENAGGVYRRFGRY